MKISTLAKNGLLKENPVFVLLLGMCPTIGVTTSAINGLGMGLATTFVLIMSNVAISLVKSQIPDKVRIPAFVVIIATFVTIVDMLLAGYVPALHAQLGIFIPLIVVNCIVLARAESFAAKNTPFYSMFDGLFMGLGFTFALILLASIRELLGANSIFGFKLGLGAEIMVFVMAPGGFICLGFIIALIGRLKERSAKPHKA